VVSARLLAQLEGVHVPGYDKYDLDRSARVDDREFANRLEAGVSRERKLQSPRSVRAHLVDAGVLPFHNRIGGIGGRSETAELL
jgi:hypothetical protein